MKLATIKLYLEYVAMNILHNQSAEGLGIITGKKVHVKESQ